MAAPLLEPGTLLLGKYKIITRIGSGGMGELYRAVQEYPHQDIAIKILHPQHMQDHSERFLDEAERAARVRHPHSVAIHSVGKTDNGLLYIAMEYIPGQDLSELITTEGPKSDGFHQESWTRRTVAIIRQIADVLDVAHNLTPPLIHRDIKPSNIRIWNTPGSEDFAKLLDFGIAKELGTSGYTRTGQHPGTPAYVSPEQVEGREIDGRTDLYSLGAVMYEILSGERPFQGRSDYDTAWMRLRFDPPSLEEKCPGVPEFVCRIVESLMARDLDGRPNCAASLRALLDRAIDRLKETAVEPAVATQDGAPVEPPTVVAGIIPSEVSKPPRRSLWRSVGWFSLGALVAGMIALAVSIRDGEQGQSRGFADDTLTSQVAPVETTYVSSEAIAESLATVLAARFEERYRHDSARLIERSRGAYVADSVRFEERYSRDSAQLVMKLREDYLADSQGLAAQLTGNESEVAQGTMSGSQPQATQEEAVLATNMRLSETKRIRFTVGPEGTFPAACAVDRRVRSSNHILVVQVASENAVGGVILEPASGKNQVHVKAWRLVEDQVHIDWSHTGRLKSDNTLELKFNRISKRLYYRLNGGTDKYSINLTLQASTVPLIACSPPGRVLFENGDESP